MNGMLKALLCICSAFIVGSCFAWGGASEFECAVTNALSNKEYLTSEAFSNYVHQCASQSDDVELALSATLVLAVSQFEKYEQTVDVAFLEASRHSVSNVLSSPSLTTNMWQYWHARMMEISHMGTDNNLQGAYLVASNTWSAIQASGFVDSTNVISRALLRYHKIGDDMTIKSAIALFTALPAAMTGRQDEANALKAYLPYRIKQEMEDFLGD